MTAEQFAYWLQGFMEMVDPKELDAREVQIIKDHLKLVFMKQTPNYPISIGQFQPTTNGTYLTQGTGLNLGGILNEGNGVTISC